MTAAGPQPEQSGCSELTCPTHGERNRRSAARSHNLMLLGHISEMARAMELHTAAAVEHTGGATVRGPFQNVRLTLLDAASASTWLEQRECLIQAAGAILTELLAGDRANGIAPPLVGGDRP